MSDIRTKYRKVQELANRGATEGERAAAREALKRLEEAHPELKGGDSPSPYADAPDPAHIRCGVVYMRTTSASGNSTSAASSFWFGAYSI